MSENEQFEIWLMETHNMTLKDYNNLNLDQRCELAADYADDMIMEME